jgi:hypothetical protein
MSFELFRVMRVDRERFGCGKARCVLCDDFSPTDWLGAAFKL